MCGGWGGGGHECLGVHATGSFTPLLLQFNRFTDTLHFHLLLLLSHFILFLSISPCPLFFSLPLFNPLSSSLFLPSQIIPPPVKPSTLYEKVYDFPILSRDVTNQTLPGGEQFNYSQAGRVWLVTSRLGTGKLLAFLYSVPPPTPRGRRVGRKHRGGE
jgi:hypothetical protein